MFCSRNVTRDGISVSALNNYSARSSHGVLVLPLRRNRDQSPSKSFFSKQLKMMRSPCIGHTGVPPAFVASRRCRALPETALSKPQLHCS